MSSLWPRGADARADRYAPPPPNGDPEAAETRDAQRERSPWHLRADIGTAAPASIDARATGEGPGRLRLVLSAGVLPAPYARLINGALTSAGAYSRAASAVLVDTLSGAVITRARAGIRPLPRAGLYADVGYGLVYLSGVADNDQVISAATRVGLRLPYPPGAYGVDAVVHLLEAEVGWEWIVAEHLYLRAGLGAAVSFASTAHVVPSQVPRALNAAGRAAAQSVANDAAGQLGHVLATYVRLPTISVGVGYAFF